MGGPSGLVVLRFVAVWCFCLVFGLYLWCWVGFRGFLPVSSWRGVVFVRLCCPAVGGFPVFALFGCPGLVAPVLARLALLGCVGGAWLCRVGPGRFGVVFAAPPSAVVVLSGVFGVAVVCRRGLWPVPGVVCRGFRACFRAWCVSCPVGPTQLSLF